MKLIQVGQVGKAHGYKGAFILQRGRGAEELPEHVRTVFVGTSPSTAKELPLTQSTWMPKGTRLKLEGIESDDAVKAARGNSVFIQRETLTPAQPGEFYVGDLVGLEVFSEETRLSLGTLVEIETVGNGAVDRWWVQAGTESFAVPAVERWVARVDLSTQSVWLRDAELLR
jgi:16S rRNA processing protein RimM